MFFALIGLIVPAAIFLSGALVVTLSYVLGRRLLRRLLRLVTRTQTLYFVVHSDNTGDVGAWLDAVIRANGAFLRGLEVVPAWGEGPAFVKARVRINKRFKAKATLARLRQGAMGIAGMQDIYVEV